MSARGNIALGWVLALLVAALFARLGVWQLARMHEKQAMLDAAYLVLARKHAQPLSMAADPARPRAYDWTSGSGWFADVPPVLLDNQAHAGQMGVRAYRVFQPAISDSSPLLVELGWLPMTGDRRMPAVPRTEGRVHVAGLLAPPPSAGFATAVAARQPDGSLLVIYLDLPLLRRALHLPALAPRVLKLDPALAPGYPRDLDVLPNTLPPQRHLGYAVQWFGLALTVIVTALVLTFRKPKRPTTR